MVAVHGAIPIEICDSHQTPVDENASMFSLKIGEIVRSMCELHHDCWTVVLDEKG
jgi:hypothetical protein